MNLRLNLIVLLIFNNYCDSDGAELKIIQEKDVFSKGTDMFTIAFAIIIICTIRLLRYFNIF